MTHQDVASGMVSEVPSGRGGAHHQQRSWRERLVNGRTLSSALAFVVLASVALGIVGVSGGFSAQVNGGVDAQIPNFTFDVSDGTVTQGYNLNGPVVPGGTPIATVIHVKNTGGAAGILTLGDINGVTLTCDPGTQGTPSPGNISTDFQLSVTSYASVPNSAAEPVDDPSTPVAQRTYKPLSPYYSAATAIPTINNGAPDATGKLDPGQEFWLKLGLYLQASAGNVYKGSDCYNKSVPLNAKQYTQNSL